MEASKHTSQPVSAQDLNRIGPAVSFFAFSLRDKCCKSPAIHARFKRNNRGDNEVQGRTDGLTSAQRVKLRKRNDRAGIGQAELIGLPDRSGSMDEQAIS